MELSQTDTAGNILRRSERNAKNHQNSFGGFGRRPFKYDDDFEYGTGVVPKSPVEMDPPGSIAGSKRRRKGDRLVAASFQEGSLKRSVSVKTPNTQSILT